ncbi:response regulator [Oceanidesulfovibrio indonesiensis]|uniref:Response regulator n=1 Tax=Oceanidesulfovibrio indonesiensis TaxID=54767 RepID=A0A7M3MAZ5_9BACT|nr:response regulator [Oceanidesulfovibrio indonesiensis]TVM14583.1 response regulator [Oceanidesulfovibrio indonesiensis]
MKIEVPNVRVLVVDDDERFRTNAVKILSTLGFAVEGAASGAETLERIMGEEFDVVVLDQKMPGMSGVETLESMRKKGCTAEVIILTGHASVDDAVMGMNLGAADYLLKPVASEQIAEKIITAYERKVDKARKLGK